MITIKLLDSVSVIESKINQSIQKHLNDLVFRKKGTLRQKVLKNVTGWVYEQPEIIAIKDNSLAAQLGLPRGTASSVAERIVLSVVQATEFEVKRFDNKLRGGITFRFQPDNFANLISLADGHVTTENDQDLHWLRGLLKEGHRTIVVGYQFIPTSGGRSGGGVMGKGSSWRIPPQFAGTEDDNFITRAFSGKEKQLEKLFAEILEG